MANLDSLELGEGVAAGPSNFHEEYESCADLNLTPSGEEITDIWGDGCLRYTFFPDWCGEEYDTEDFISGDMCCVCGGGRDRVLQDLIDAAANAAGLAEDQASIAPPQQAILN